jgi:hypothetical protein
MYRHGRSAVFFDLDRSRPRQYPRAFVGLRSLIYVVYQSLNLRRSTVCISFPSCVHGPVSFTLSHFLLPPFFPTSYPSVRISFPSLVRRPVSFTVSHFLLPSSVPTSSVVHQFPVCQLCVCVCVWCVYMCVYGGAAYAILLTSYSVLPSLM